MHTFYTKISNETRFDNKIAKSLSQEVLKNTHRIKINRGSYVAIPEQVKIDAELKRISMSTNLNTIKRSSLALSKQKSLSTKYETIISKISDVPREKSKVLGEVEKIKKKVLGTIKSLENFDVISAEEQKEYLKNYSESVKTNFFTLKKTGIKFRRESLRKSIASIKNLKLTSNNKYV